MFHKTCNTVEAKAKLNELLNYVGTGHEVVIQRRGKAVARMVAMTGETMGNSDQTKIFLSKLRDFHRRIRRLRSSKSKTVELLRELRQES